MGLEISKVLCANTAHISQQTADELIWNRHTFSHPIYPKENNCGESYGWFVLTCDLEDEQYNIPDDLWEAMKFAEENGCDWLNLDADGPIVDGLKTYEWS